MIPFPQSHTAPPSERTALSAAEALRIAAQLADTQEDVHAITKVVLALVGEDDDLQGAAAETALARHGVPAHARALLLAGLGPAETRPSVSVLRAALEAAALEARQPGARRSGVGGVFDELQRRRVTRTALWYVGVSVAVVEAANLFLPTFGASPDIVRFLAIIAVCGLPIALTLSWVFDLSPAIGSRSARWSRLALVGAVVVVSAGSAVMIWKSGARAGPPVSAAATADGIDPAHIAVLGFTSTEGDEELAAFATQLHIRLIDGLSLAASSGSENNERPMRVLSYAGVLPFMRNHVPADSLVRSRGVGTMLSGDVVRARDGVIVHVRLIDARTQEQLRTVSTAVHVDDRVALIDAVADSVARLVRVRLGKVVINRMRLLETRSTPAFEHLMWAMQRVDAYQSAFMRGDYAGAARALAQADSLLVDAERRDPRWTEPIVERGRVERRRALLGLAQRDTAALLSALAVGIRHADRALALHTRDAKALELRGELRYLHIRNAAPRDSADIDALRTAAEQDLTDALSGNPQPARALRLLAELAGSGGRLDDALRYGDRAYREDPFMEEAPSTVFRLYEYSLAHGKDREAAQWCVEGMNRFSDMPMFFDCTLALASWTTEYDISPDSAWSLVAAELAAHPQGLHSRLEGRLHAMVAAVLVRRGFADSARTILGNARRRDSTPGFLRAAAGVYGLLGDSAQALATVQQAVQLTPPRERATLYRLPELRSAIAVDPRVRALLAQPPGS